VARKSIEDEQMPEPRIQVRVQNFRLFRDSGWFDLDPLTCVVGRNSSGKSSIVFALLLLKQSIEKKVFGSAITPLSLSGDYCDLGQFKDLVHDHDESSKITYSFRVPLSLVLNSASSQSAPLIELGSSRASRSSTDTFRLDYGFFFPDIEPIRAKTIEVTLTFSEDQPFGPSLSRCEIYLSDTDRVKFVRTINGERKPHWRTYCLHQPLLRAMGFQPTAYSFFPQLVSRRSRKDLGSSKQKKAFLQVFRAGQAFFEFLESLLGKSEMIGPFRQPPERRYAFAGFGANKIGPSGEQAIDLLITESLIRKGTSQPLVAAVEYWLKALKLADSLRIRDVAKHLNLFEVDLKVAGRRVRANLVDVGFGISQVLPVLVQGLLMRRGGIYFVQEPEIHLHPDAQAQLADFFIYLACQGVTCIVETHSEYLLLRLRRRLAEKLGPPPSVVPKLAGQTRRLTEKSASVLVSENIGSEAKITKLEIGKGFQFENMPSGFMNQATQDRMGLLKAVSRRNG
jgi:predicted ATPase